MTNREKFKEIFGKDIHWSSAISPQILALSSAYIDGIDCMEEWLNSEYKESLEQEPVLNKIKEIVAKWKVDGIDWDSIREIADIVDKAESEG